MERTRRWVLGTCLTVSTAAAGRQSIFGGSDDAPSVDNGDEDDGTPDQGTAESDRNCQNDVYRHREPESTNG
jgi:hypothetical protein